jgi:hypothetical protein
MGIGSHGSEFQHALETNDDGAIFVAKRQSIPTSPPPIRMMLKQALDGLACGGNWAPNADSDTEENIHGVKHFNHKDKTDGNSLSSSCVDGDDCASVTSLELLIVLGVEEDCGEETRMKSMCGIRQIGCWLLGLVFLILAIVLPLTLNKDNDYSRGMGVVLDSAESDIGLVLDSSDIKAYDILRPIVANPDALLDPSTAEGQAFLDVEKERDPFNIQQLYALQMLYYSTAGESWVFNHGWESHSQRRMGRSMKRSFADTSLCLRAGIALCRNQGNDKYAVAGLDLGM